MKHCLAKLSPDDQACFEQDRKRYAETGEAEALSRLGQLVAESGTYAHWTLRRGGDPARPCQGNGQGRAARATGAADRGQPRAGPGRPQDEQELRQHHRHAEEPEAVAQKIRKMPTDPQRVRLSDPGEATRCPVWGFHQIYSSTETCAQLAEGCRSAHRLPGLQAAGDRGHPEGAGPWRERAAAIMDNPCQLHWLVEIGTERARTPGQTDHEGRAPGHGA